MHGPTESDCPEKGGKNALVDGKLSWLAPRLVESLTREPSHRGEGQFCDYAAVIVFRRAWREDQTREALSEQALTRGRT